MSISLERPRVLNAGEFSSEYGSVKLELHDDMVAVAFYPDENAESPFREIDLFVTSDDPILSRLAEIRNTVFLLVQENFPDAVYMQFVVVNYLRDMGFTVDASELEKLPVSVIPTAWGIINVYPDKIIFEMDDPENYSAFYEGEMFVFAPEFNAPVNGRLADLVQRFMSENEYEGVELQTGLVNYLREFGFYVEYRDLEELILVNAEG